jgi:hypothetical protein
MSSQIQSLSNEFNILMNKYQDTYKKYIITINSDNQTLKTINESAFFGQNKITTMNNTNISKCQTACLSNSSCSGVTFNTLSNNCNLSRGYGTVLPTPNSKAIVKEAIYYSYELQNLNNKLIKINEQMMNISKNNYNKFQSNLEETKVQEQTMNLNYHTLSEERKEIEKMIKQFATVNKAYENGNIIVTANYYSYIILLLIVILLIFMFLKFYVKSSQSGGGLNILHRVNINRIHHK